MSMIEFLIVKNKSGFFAIQPLPKVDKNGNIVEIDLTKIVIPDYIKNKR